MDKLGISLVIPASLARLTCKKWRCGVFSHFAHFYSLPGAVHPLSLSLYPLLSLFFFACVPLVPVPIIIVPSAKSERSSCFDRFDCHKFLLVFIFVLVGHIPCFLDLAQFGLLHRPLAVTLICLGCLNLIMRTFKDCIM